MSENLQAHHSENKNEKPPSNQFELEFYKIYRFSDLPPNHPDYPDLSRGTEGDDNLPEKVIQLFKYKVEQIGREIEACGPDLSKSGKRGDLSYEQRIYQGALDFTGGKTERPEFMLRAIKQLTSEAEEKSNRIFRDVKHPFRKDGLAKSNRKKRQERIEKVHALLIEKYNLKNLDEKPYFKEWMGS
jgi:hypothetical protein